MPPLSTFGRLARTRRFSPDHRPNERGIALVAVLWGLTMLAIVATALLADTRTEARLGRNLLESAKAEALAEAGIYRAMAGLVEPDPQRAWRAGGTPYRFALGDGEIEVTIEDEGGKIDLNRAPQRLLQGLLVASGLEPEDAASLVDAIADFSDSDSDRRPNGAEDADYAAAGRDYGTKDAPFETVAELQQVLGIDQALYDRIAPYVTVHAGRSQIDLTVAPPQVLLALPNMESADVEAVLRRREAAAGGAATSQGTAFTVRAQAMTGNGGIFVREAVIRRTGDARKPFVILEWRRVW